MAGQDGGPLVVGVDLGGTKILAGVVGADNRILGRGKRTTPAKDGGPAILAAMIECVDEALPQAGVSREEIAAGGIGSPGPLDVETGVILFSANLNVKNYPIGPELSAALGAPVIVQNDVRVGGYGEFVLGAGRGYRDVIAAFVGTGIGGCIIIDGRIVAGSTANAGEIGHIIVKAGGPKCGCGQRGCMEAAFKQDGDRRRGSPRRSRRRRRRSLAPRWPARGAGSRAATWPRPSTTATRWRSARSAAPPTSSAWVWGGSSTSWAPRS